MKRKDSPSTIALQTTAVILIIFLFREPIAQLLNSVLVSPIFSKIPNTWSTTIIVLILCCTLLYKIRSTKILAKNIPIGIITLAFYLIQRFNPYWDFQEVINIQWLYLWDLVVLTLLISYLKELWLKAGSPEEKLNSSIWIEDIPVDKIDQDTFQRRHYAEELADQIQKMYSKGSFAIGILGEYGSGKTSFINLIKKHLDRKKVDIIEFNAWKSEKSDNIQRDFFDHLSNELSGTDNNLSTLLTSYSRKLSRIDTSIEKFVKRAGLISQMINKIETEADEYERINKILKTSERKLVIVIDDMDRLYSDEVIEVLRLVRNTANFTNTFYLLAYEKDYIQKAIKEELKVDNRSPFMDKIVQMEVPLPKREQHDLLDLVRELLHEKIEKSELEILDKYVFKYGFNKEWEYTFHTIFRNARDVIKFFNSFLVSYSLLKNEVLLDKLFLIELVKYRYPQFYERLYQHRDDFLALKDSRKSYEIYYVCREVTDADLEEDRTGKKYAYLKFLKEEKYHADDIRIIRGLMQAIFNDYNIPNRTSSSIEFPSSFERYFRFRLSSTEVSGFEFRKAWNAGYPDMVQFIKLCHSKNLTKQLANLLFMVVPKQKEEFELLIKSLFQIGPLYKDGGNNYNFDYDALIDLLWNYKGMPAERLYRDNPERYTTLLKNLFLNAYFPFQFQCEVIARLNEGGRKVPLSQKELIDYQIIHFGEYVRIMGLDATAMDIMWTIRIKKEILGSDGKVIDKELRFVEELKPIIQEYLADYDLLDFLRGCIKKEHGINGYTIYPAMIDLFESHQMFYNLVSSSEKTTNEVKNEFLDFYDRLINNGFEQPVEFDFKTELKPKFYNED